MVETKNNYVTHKFWLFFFYFSSADNLIVCFKDLTSLSNFLTRFAAKQPRVLDFSLTLFFEKLGRMMSLFQWWFLLRCKCLDSLGVFYLISPFLGNKIIYLVLLAVLSFFLYLQSSSIWFSHIPCKLTGSCFSWSAGLPFFNLLAANIMTKSLH